MNKWAKRKWIRALKSGKYKKGWGTLKRDDEYCCLGVLICELAPEFAKEVDGWLQVKISYKGRDRWTGGTLPEDLTLLFGLDNENLFDLMKLNDKADTFKSVIKYIEENL